MTFKRYRKSAHKTNPINRGFKERVIVEDLIEYLGSEHTIIQNQTIKGGQSKRRPDVLINCDSYCVIIEIDERQHRSYLGNEAQRVKELIDCIDGGLVLIRFNPDAYKDANRVSRRSLFSKTKGTRIYKIGCPRQYEVRMNTLKSLLTHYLSHAPEQAFVEHKLFFDKYDPN